MPSSLTNETISMLFIHYRSTATTYFTSEQVQPFGFAKRAMIRHLYRPYTRRGTTWECLIYNHRRQRRPNNVQQDFPQLTRLLLVSKSCRPNNLVSRHSGCLYWDILSLVVVSYSDPANKRHSLMLV